MKKFLYGFVILCLLFFLFRFPSKAFDASLAGLLLWFETLLPTLFPLMILSNLLIRLGLVEQVMYLFAPILRFLFGVSNYGSYVIVVGFFCGYPMGAKVIADLKNEGCITLEEAQFLIGFCNNVSPMFIMNYLVLQHLNAPQWTGRTLLAIYGAPLLYGCIRSLFMRKQNHLITNRDIKKQTPKHPINFEVVDICIMNAIVNITKLGGYVILFSLLTNMMLLLPLPYTLAKVSIAGIMEVTNGIHLLASQSMSFKVTYLLLLAVTSFGGLSSVAQTESMLAGTGIRLQAYLLEKGIITLLSVIIGAFFLF